MDSRALINIIDNLDSTSITDALSANQGRVLKELIDGINDYVSKDGDTLNNKDLNTLIDKVYIGYGFGLTNTPYGNAGFLINIPNPNNAAYTRQIFSHYSNNIIYTRSLNNGVWNDWAPLTSTDSGWIDITLSGNVQTYTNNNRPQYRKIGNVVYLRGSAKNITADNTTIGVLPAGYRPTDMSHNYLQPTSNENSSTNFCRIKVGTDGAIIVEGISNGITATYNSSDWFPINTCFLID